jgi:hypothetical protein
MDENQILNEMKGELLEEFVYDMDVQGKHVTSLSYAGVKEAIRRRGKYETLDVHIDEDKDQYRCLVKVRDLIRQIDVLGASTCEKSKPFAYTLAVNKAERNAFRKLIPEKLIAAMVKEFLERRKARTVPVPITPAQDKPAERGTSPSPESPILTETSPEPWKVPIDLNPEKLEGYETRILKKENLAVGRAIYLYNEAAFIPTRPFSIEDPALTNFLQRKLNEKKAKHEAEFHYEIVAKDRGLEAVRARGSDKNQVEELESLCSWTFYKALTRPTPDRSQVGGPIR